MLSEQKTTKTVWVKIYEPQFLSVENAVYIKCELGY
jgi:hypothetical protein